MIPPRHSAVVMWRHETTTLLRPLRQQHQQKRRLSGHCTSVSHCRLPANTWHRLRPAVIPWVFVLRAEVSRERCCSELRPPVDDSCRPPVDDVRCNVLVAESYQLYPLSLYRARRESGIKGKMPGYPDFHRMIAKDGYEVCGK